jgi:hypothetical protein
MTKTPVYTVTPTKTTTPTPTTTPTKTVTPTVTKTPTQTPSVTPTITPTKTTTPTVTSTVTPTVTPSPSRTSLIGPFFRFANEIGSTTDLVFRTEIGQTFDIRWGDGTSVNAVPSNVVFGDVTYSKLYGGTIFTGSADNFRVSSISSVNKIQQLSLRNISAIEVNQYTFSAFSAVTFIKVLDSSISSFNHSLPNGLINLEFTNVIGTSNLTFNPVFTNRAPFKDLTLINTNIKSFNYNITGGTGTASQVIKFIDNLSLTSITMSVSSVLNTLTITNNNVLSTINIPNQLTAATNMITLTVTDNDVLTGWTYTIPSTVTIANMQQNKFSSFNISLTGNTNLTKLFLFNQQSPKISALTNTISACTSLTQLRLDNNNLTLLPPIFPNSLQILRFENNKVTGYTSNIPTSLIYFDGSSAAANQNVFTSWNNILTSSTNLNYFNLTNVGLTSWGIEFPLSIREVYLGQNRIFPIFNIDLVSGATILDLGFNTGLTGVRNLSFNNTIQTLKLNSTAIISDINLNTPFPSSLRNLYLNKTLLTNFSISFSNCPSINYITFNQTPLNQTSVDFILYDLRYNNSANYGQLILNGPGGPATPSAAGLVNRSYLINTRGWQVPIN